MAKIKVIDEDQGNEIVIRLLLEDEGYELTSEKADLVIVDINSHKQVGQLVCLGSVPTIITTTLSEVQFNALGLVYSAVVFKPFDCEEFLDKVKQLTANR